MIFLFLIENFVLRNWNPNTCYPLHAGRWILERSHFSPEGLSDFSISGELGDKSVLAVDQKASREKTGRSEGKC